jgi:ornithine cyclodeaminase/alanine dehydrogenase-like protein (mu-crystallin family)
VIPFIGQDVEKRLDWIALTDALAAGHSRPRADLGDVLLRRGEDSLLSRAAIIDGLGSLVKTATVFPGNSRLGLTSINGAVAVFSDRDGSPEAMIDFHLLTKWKTAGDSLLASRLLAPPGVGQILIVGAGAVARSLREAYGAIFPDARYAIWNRTRSRAEERAAEMSETTVAADLAEAVERADIVTVATMSTDPIINGEWLRPGQHVDLIGAYRSDMREADDVALSRSRIFVDSRETVLEHIGELRDPISRGVLTPSDIVADFYELSSFVRGPDEITLFKNGGGAHLDLMTARYVLSATEV